jgi:protein TonB
MFAIRVPFSVVAGALASVAIFLGLAQLVGVPFEVTQTIAAPRIDFTPQRIDTPIETKREERVKREPPTPQPEGPTFSDDFGGDIGVVRIQPQPVVALRSGEGIGLRGVDGDVIPIVRPTPEYPAGALSRGLEGRVKVQFSVTAAGTVRDAIVVESEPGTTFDEAALKAIARWRYNPRVVDGVAVERVGLETVIRFELDAQTR